MSGINRVSESIKKKMTLQDYKPAPQNSDTLTLQNDNTSKHLNSIETSSLKSNEKNTSLDVDKELMENKKTDPATLQQAKTSINVHQLEQQESSGCDEADTLKCIDEEKLKGVEVNTSKSIKDAKLIKMTVYLTEEANKQFNELYAHRILNNNKSNKYDMFCEAIHLLYQKEKN